MRRTLLTAGALILVAAAAAWSGSGARPSLTSGISVDVQNRNPWTHLQTNDDAETFHFVVVSDRTGGHRARVFSQAVDQINLLQPAFVLCVGDLIEGYSKDKAKLASEWKEFQTYVAKLQMPFFYVAGNHDVANAVQSAEWKERFGRGYYHFTYRNVLFLVVNSDDPFEDKSPRLSQDQLQYFAEVLKGNPAPRWTVVCVHKPMWTSPNLATSGWLELEKLLADRQYTVFAGHEHFYRKYVRHRMNYYQLATTGGGSKLRGIRHGEFDHLVWVTLKKEPVLANVLLAGIYDESLRQPVSTEEGFVYPNRKQVFPAGGRVYMDGVPLVHATLTLYAAEPALAAKFKRVADAFSEADGSFAWTTYQAFDGAPAGTYVVTVTRQGGDPDLRVPPGPNVLPAKYATPTASALRADISSMETNDLKLNLESR